MKNIKIKLIAVMFLFYFVLFIVDMHFTFQNMELEGNPISIYFISLIGYPLNLLIPYACICIPLSFKRIWDRINTDFKVFFLFYVVLLVFTVGHFRGVYSWIK